MAMDSFASFGVSCIHVCYRNNLEMPVTGYRAVNIWYHANLPGVTEIYALSRNGNAWARSPLCRNIDPLIPYLNAIRAMDRTGRLAGMVDIDPSELFPLADFIMDTYTDDIASVLREIAAR